MRKVLFGTTALVAAGMLAMPALADEHEEEKMEPQPISIGISGYFNAAVSMASHDRDTGTRSYGIVREGEIIFSGSTALDGQFLQGVGVNVQLEAETSGDQIDESFMWLDGTFGQLRVGSFDGAMAVMGIYPAGVGAPLHGLLWEVYTVVDTAGVGEGAFGLAFDGDSSKVAWYSPTVAGVRVGVSYTPEGDSDDNAGSRSTSHTGQHSEVVGVGGNWSGDFGGASVSVGAGLTTGKLEAPGDNAASKTKVENYTQDREEWVIAGRASMADITIAGNYSVDNNGANDSDRTTWAVGASYSGMAPFTYGIRYANTSREQGAAPDQDSSGVSIGLSMPLGPGLSAAGEVQFWDIEDGMGSNEGTVAIVGVSVRF